MSAAFIRLKITVRLLDWWKQCIIEYHTQQDWTWHIEESSLDRHRSSAKWQRSMGIRKHTAGELSTVGEQILQHTYVYTSSVFFFIFFPSLLHFHYFNKRSIVKNNNPRPISIRHDVDSCNYTTMLLNSRFQLSWRCWLIFFNGSKANHRFTSVLLLSYLW